MVPEEVVEVAQSDKPASEDAVFVTVTAQPNSAEMIPVEIIAVNVCLAKIALETSVVDPVRHNVSEASMALPKLVVGIDAVETVEVAQLDIVARMVFACAIPLVTPEIVDLMAVEDHAVPALPMLPVTLIPLIRCTELATKFAISVEMESVPLLRHLLQPELVNTI